MSRRPQPSIAPGSRSGSTRAVTLPRALVATLLVAASMAFLGAPASSQTGTFSGTVAYGNGELASGVRVTFYESPRRGRRTTFLGNTLTDRSGVYTFDAGPGCYTAVVIAPTNSEFNAAGSGQRFDEKFGCIGGTSTGFRSVLVRGGSRDTPEDPGPISARRPECFREVFRDDFTATGTPSSSSWLRYNGPGNNGFGLRRPDTISQSNGRLHIKASMKNGVLNSGGMSHRLNQTYGYWEFRVRVDADPSGATSAVVLTWPQSQRHPIDGEIDIFETFREGSGPPAGDPDRSPIQSFVHHGASNQVIARTHQGTSGRDWNVMALEWVPGEIIFYKNGVPAPIVTTGVPNVPHHLAIQLDAWKQQMGSPVVLQVDWARVFDYTCS